MLGRVARFALVFRFLFKTGKDLKALPKAPLISRVASWWS
jgi:hypothetical protein